MQIRKWCYQRFWGGRSSKETPVVLFVGGDVSLDDSRVLSILESSFETDVYRPDNKRLVEDGTLRPDTTLRQLVSRSRAPVMVFGVPDEVPAGELNALIERFHPARGHWWFEDYRRHVRNAAKANGRDLARNRLDHLLSARAETTDRLLPPALDPVLDDRSTWDNHAVHALLWYIRHARFRDARLQTNRDIHLYGGEQLRLTPKDTLEEVLQAAGIGTDILTNTRFATAARSKRQPEVGLPVALSDACVELQEWLDRHSSR